MKGDGVARSVKAHPPPALRLKNSGHSAMVLKPPFGRGQRLRHLFPPCYHSSALAAPRLGAFSARSSLSFSFTAASISA